MPRSVKDEVEIAMAGPFIDILRDVLGTDGVGSEGGVKPVLDVKQERSETLRARDSARVEVVPGWPPALPSVAVTLPASKMDQVTS